RTPCRSVRASRRNTRARSNDDSAYPLHEASSSRRRRAPTRRTQRVPSRRDSRPLGTVAQLAVLRKQFVSSLPDSNRIRGAVCTLIQVAKIEVWFCLFGE